MTERNANPASARKANRSLTAILLMLAAAVAGLAAYIALRPDAPAPPPVDGGDRADADRVQAIAQARRLLEVRQFDPARQLLETCVKAYPREPAFVEMLARALAAMGQADEAERRLDEALRAELISPELLWIKGELLRRRGGDSLRSFEHAAKLADRSHADIWSRYGIVLLARGETAQGETYLLRAVEAGHRDGATCAAMGEAALRRNDFAAAERWMDEARKLDQTNPFVWLRLAQAQKNAGRAADAEQTLLRGVGICRGKDLGAMLLELGMLQLLHEGPRERVYAEAAETFARAADYAEVRARASLQAARCYYQLGQYARAMKHIDAAAELAGDDPEVRDWMTRIERERFGPGGAEPPQPATGSYLDMLRRQGGQGSEIRSDGSSDSQGR
ncbi:MAG TPA: tetratricopeptide repeat protein [Phycisphaerae bacterium]|nr:tetratricopeptide repeat protein [Phycisphaerae bacterium]